jgi:hypothetical protein
MRSNKKESGVRKAGWFHTFALVLYAVGPLEEDGPDRAPLDRRIAIRRI